LTFEMKHVVKLKRNGEWVGPAADTIILAHYERHRRRLRMRGLKGTDFLLDLPRVTKLKNGDGFLLNDGSIISIKAASEPLLEIKCDDPVQLARIAWHIGNRHLAAEFCCDRIRIVQDHVIAEMVINLGAEVAMIKKPFNPEGGAYSEAHSHGDDHDNGAKQ